MITLQEINERLEKFREEWQVSGKSRRETILLQARALKIAREKILKKNPQLRQVQMSFAERKQSQEKTPAIAEAPSTSDE